MWSREAAAFELPLPGRVTTIPTAPTAMYYIVCKFPSFFISVLHRSVLASSGIGNIIIFDTGCGVLDETV